MICWKIGSEKILEPGLLSETKLSKIGCRMPFTTDPSKKSDFK